MNGFRDAITTTEQYEFIRQQIHIAARAKLWARDLIGVKRPPLGWGKSVFRYDVASEFSTAQIAYGLVEQLDQPKLTRTSVDIPVIQHGFDLDDRDVAASMTAGQSLQSNAVEKASRKVAELENALILVGTTAGAPGPAINGLYNSAGNDFSTTADFGTFGKPTVAVEGAMNLLLNDNIEPPYHMVLNPTQYAELKGSISSTGVHELPIIEDMLNDGGGSGGPSIGPDRGRIWQSATMAASDGMLLPVDGSNLGFFELVIEKDLDVDLWNRPIADGGGLKGKVFESLIPIIYETNAICKISDI